MKNAGWFKAENGQRFRRTQVVYCTVKESKRQKKPPRRKSIASTEKLCYEVWAVIEDGSVLAVRKFAEKNQAERLQQILNGRHMTRR